MYVDANERKRLLYYCNYARNTSSPGIPESLFVRDETPSTTEVKIQCATLGVRRQYQGQAALTGPRSKISIPVRVVATDGLSSDPNEETQMLIRIFYPNALGFWGGDCVFICVSNNMR